MKALVLKLMAIFVIIFVAVQAGYDGGVSVFGLSCFLFGGYVKEVERGEW